MKRYDLTLHHTTHVGRKLYQDIYMICAKFSKRIRGYFQRGGYGPSLIGNIEEIPVFFNISSTRIV